MDLGFDRQGTGEPLLLIHGLGGSRRIWRPVIDRLAREREVLAVDMPGFGDSPPLPNRVPATAANLGAAVADLCDSLGLQSPHVAGNSLGAWAALELAKGGRARTVCAISPAGLWRRPLGPRRSDTRRLVRRLRPLLSVLLFSERARISALSTFFARPERLSRREARAVITDWLASPGYDAANEHMRAGVFERPELVTVPATVAWGAEDRLLGPPRPERMPPGARFLVLEGCGHTPTWDDPELIAELLLGASRDQASSGASSPGQAPVARRNALRDA